MQGEVFVLNFVLKYVGLS